MNYETDSVCNYTENLVELKQIFDEKFIVKVVILSEYSCKTPTQNSLVSINFMVLQTIKLPQDYFVDRLIVRSDHPRYTPPALKLVNRE